MRWYASRRVFDGKNSLIYKVTGLQMLDVSVTPYFRWGRSENYGTSWFCFGPIVIEWAVAKTGEYEWDFRK